MGPRPPSIRPSTCATVCKEATGGTGVDVIIDPVGGPLAEQALRAGRWGGRFVTVGLRVGGDPRIPLNLVLLKGLAIVGFEMRTFALHAPEEAAPATAAS